MAILSDQTWSFDAEPAYSEFPAYDGGQLCPGPGLNHTLAQMAERVTSPLRHGAFAGKILLRQGDRINGCSSTVDGVQIRCRPSSGHDIVEGSESWQAWSWYFPTGAIQTNSWNAIYAPASTNDSASTHPSYGSTFSAWSGNQLTLRMRYGHTPSPGASDFTPNAPNGYNVTEYLLGTGAPRPWTLDVWHDFYQHTTYQARTNGILTIWHREENGAWAKLYSNEANSGALIQRNPHPTLLYNDAYGAPGDNGTLPAGQWIGFYRTQSATTDTYYNDGFRRRGSEAAILADFPSGGGSTAPPNPGTGRSRMGITVPGTLGAIGNDLKRTIKRNAIPAGATIDIHTFYAWLKGPVSGGSQSFKAIVYDHTGTDPVTRMGETVEVTLAQGASEAWAQLSPTTPIRAPSPVAIGLICGGPGTGEVGSQNVANSLWVNSDTYSDGASPIFGTPSLSNIEIAICADYTIVADTIAPTLLAAAITGAGVAITFSEALDPASTPVSSAFTVRVGGSARALNNDLAISGANVNFTLAGLVNEGDAVEFDYVAPSTGKLRDIALNNVANITASAVTNNTNQGSGQGIQRIQGVAGTSGSGITGTRISGTRIS